MQPSVRLEKFTGAALERHIVSLARLRIEVFRDFPYLYDGDMAYEEQYLRTYINAPDSAMFLVFDGDNVVGASTAVPLANETEEIQEPFNRAGILPADVFYFGESILRSDYRGRGIGVRFFRERESHARATGAFRYACFCAVDRADDHPLRPRDYVSLDQFWNKRGFEKKPHLRTTMSWREIGGTRATAKTMTFWMKAL